VSNINLGVKYMLFASLLFAFMGACAKELSQSLSSVEIVFFRNIFGVAIILFSIYKSPLTQKGGKFWLLIFRGTIGFLALLMFFYNIANIPLADAMTFSKTSPIFTAIFAYFLLKEKLGKYGWLGLIIGFIGILFITKFDGSNLSKSDYLGILSGVGAALAYTSIRELKNYYDSRAIVLSFVTIGTVGPAIFMILAPMYDGTAFDFIIAPFVMPELHHWVYIVMLGIFSTYAQIFMTKAYGETKAGIVGTVSYSNIVFAIVLGLFLGDSLPDVLTTLGIILIIFSGILISKK
jgi:drug/metabolite transporter (DMT)-like permease